MSVHLRRRVVALVAVLVAVAAGIPLLTGGSEPVAGPDGAAARATAPAAAPPDRETALLRALAPLLGADGGASRRADAGGGDGAVAGTAARGTLRAGAGSNPAPSATATAARLFVVGFPGTAPDASFFERLRATEWGGVLVTRGNFVDEGQFAALAGEVGAVARAAGRAAPLVAVRQAGGEDSELPGLPPRPAAELRDAAGAGAEARAAGTRLRALGVTMTLAPDADLGAAGGPWDGRAFGAEPGPVAQKVRAALDGYRAARVAAAVGHFPGEGAASADPALGAATVGLGLDELRARDVRPFAAVAGRAPVVQMSGALYAAWDGVTPATMLPEAVRLLRGAGFRGVVLSADLGAASFVSGVTPGEAAVQALRAGCDLLLLPGDADDQEQALRAVVRAIGSGEIPRGRVREALGRVEALRRAYAIE